MTTRPCWPRRAVVAGFALAVAAAARPPDPTEDFPVPPIPPAQPPTDQAAPMPDTTAVAPTTPAPRGAQLRPDFFNRPFANTGQGYTPGSTIEGQQEQRFKPIPGINLKMPLQ